MAGVDPQNNDGAIEPQSSVFASKYTSNSATRLQASYLIYDLLVYYVPSEVAQKLHFVAIVDQTIKSQLNKLYGLCYIPVFYKSHTVTCAMTSGIFSYK